VSQIEKGGGAHQGGGGGGAPGGQPWGESGPGLGRAASRGEKQLNDQRAGIFTGPGGGGGGGRTGIFFSAPWRDREPRFGLLGPGEKKAPRAGGRGGGGGPISVGGGPGFVGGGWAPAKGTKGGGGIVLEAEWDPHLANKTKNGLAAIPAGPRNGKKHPPKKGGGFSDFFVGGPGKRSNAARRCFL